jgi:hypothetical protein
MRDQIIAFDQAVIVFLLFSNALAWLAVAALAGVGRGWRWPRGGRS